MAIAPEQQGSGQAGRAASRDSDVIGVPDRTLPLRRAAMLTLRNRLSESLFFRPLEGSVRPLVVGADGLEPPTLSV